MSESMVGTVLAVKCPVSGDVLECYGKCFVLIEGQRYLMGLPKVSG